MLLSSHHFVLPAVRRRNSASHRVEDRHHGELCRFSARQRSRDDVLPIALLALDIYPLKRLNADPRTWFQPQFRHVW
jgi:hypothetical protein